MSQVVHKKQIGMYTFALNDEGALHIQAPTLLKPITMEARQVQDLAHWLAEVYQVEIAPPSVGSTSTQEGPVGAPATPPVAVQASTADAGPAGETATVKETPEETTRRVIRQQVASAREQRPESLALEKRDLLIEQITRVAEIRPLLSQGKVSWKKIMLWVDQEIEESSKA